MDRIIFKNEIDRLYEKLYSMNEGLSSIESKDFIKGFKDGIKEGYKLLNDINEWNPFKAAAGAIGTAVGGAKGLYQQGKKLAGKVWSTVADFATQTYTKIKTGVDTAAQWVKTQPSKIKAYLEGVYQGVVADMKSAYETLKDKGVELTTAIGKIWTDVTTTIQTAIQTAKSNIAKTEEEAKAWFETNKQVLLDEAASLAQSSKDWLKEMGTKITDVVTKVGNGTLTALKGIGLAVAVLTLGPVWMLYKLVQEVPELYKAAQTQVEAGMTQLGNYWSQQKQAAGEAYAAGWNKGMAATGVPSGKIPVRNPTTGRMEPAPTEGFVYQFEDFVNEKRKGMNKAAFLEMIGKGKKKKGKKGKKEKVEESVIVSEEKKFDAKKKLEKWRKEPYLGDGKKPKCTECGKGKKCKCSK